MKEAIPNLASELLYGLVQSQGSGQTQEGFYPSINAQSQEKSFQLTAYKYFLSSTLKDVGLTLLHCLGSADQLQKGEKTSLFITCMSCRNT